MKKATFVVALLVLFAIALYAGQTSGSAQSSSKTSTANSTANPPLKTIAGKISEDGKTFTADKDSKQWTLKNPEDVKGHEGHHVKLQAHVYKDKRTPCDESDDDESKSRQEGQIDQQTLLVQ